MSAKNGKPCKKCGGNEWYKNGNCVSCALACSRRWRDNNPDKAKASRAKWRNNHPNRNHGDPSRWNASNPEKMRAASERWNANNPGKASENVTKWRERNPDKVKANANNRRTRKAKAGGSFTADEWKQLCDQYDNRCLKCGEVKPLTADHVIPVSMGGTSDISNIQPLCQSCNSRKWVTIKDYRNQPLAGRWKTISIFDVIDG